MRKVIDVAVPLAGRDQGKTFRITEMDAATAEMWGMRALSVMSRGGVELPPAALQGNMVVVAAFGLQALMSANFEEARPLLDEMWACVQCVPAPAAEPNVVRRLVADDTEEVSTRLWLRDKVLELHTGFSVVAVLSNLRNTAQTAAMNSSQSDIPTSPQSSELSPAPG